MPTDLALVLLLLAATIIMFALNRPRMDAVALIMMTVLPLTGVITMSDAFGVPILVLAILYMLFARRWLAAHEAPGKGGVPRPRLAHWVEEYRLAGREHRLGVLPDSALAGKRLDQLDLRGTAGVNIVAVERPATTRSSISCGLACRSRRWRWFLVPLVFPF